MSVLKFHSTSTAILAILTKLKLHNYHRGPTELQNLLEQRVTPLGVQEGHWPVTEKLLGCFVPL